MRRSSGLRRCDRVRPHHPFPRPHPLRRSHGLQRPHGLRRSHGVRPCFRLGTSQPLCKPMDRGNILACGDSMGCGDPLHCGDPMGDGHPRRASCQSVCSPVDSRKHFRRAFPGRSAVTLRRCGSVCSFGSPSRGGGIGLRQQTSLMNNKSGTHQQPEQLTTFTQQLQLGLLRLRSSRADPADRLGPQTPAVRCWRGGPIKERPRGRRICARRGHFALTWRLQRDPPRGLRSS